MRRGIIIRCQYCEHESREGASFCANCGRALLFTCSGCRQPARRGAAFCDNCGQRLATVATARAQDSELGPLPPGELQPPRAERRRLTVMFCDLVDSTSLSTRLDPEDFHDLLAAYQGACSTVVQRFGGHIAQYLGDGILVYFGYPEAHEDDGPRALHAGLGIVAAMVALDACRPAEKAVQLQVRVGIHTGLVVVAEVGSGNRQEQLALGETPNIAARIQSLASPNAVLISDATLRLTQSQFATRLLGEYSLKGIEKMVRLYEVAAAVGGLGAPPKDGAEPARLIGRQSEILLLQDRWAQVLEGTGQVVCLSGEAGIGKSRLVQALRQHAAAAAPAALYLSLNGSAYHQNTALHPVIELLQALLRFERSESPQQRLDKLRAGLEERSLADARTLNVLAALLSLPTDAAQPAPVAGTQKETLECILTLLLALAAHEPVLLVVEDLHWLDPSTLELLGLLIDQVPTSNLLLLTAARPSFEPPWGARPQVNALRLGRLTRVEVSQLVVQVTGGKALPPAVLDQIVDKTDGVPLFVEELTKTVLELGLVRDAGRHYELAGPMTQLAIPATVHDSLMARLDRLSAAKTVAQLGAVLGRSFAYDLLLAVAQMNEVGLRHALQQLVAAEVLQQRGVPPSATYTFKHALVQDAAYESLLRSMRQVFHQRAARALVDSFGHVTRAQPEVLAHHYTKAGLAALAIPQWQRAAQLSVDRAAHREAVSQFSAALAQCATLATGAERSRLELEVYLGLGPALMATRGYAAPEVERAYQRAHELASELGDPAQRFTVLFGLWRYYLNRARLPASRQLAEQLIDSADQAGGEALSVMAHYALGTTQYYQGELEPAAQHLERTVALYDARQHLSVAASDPRITSLSCAAWSLWQLGQVDCAMERSNEAIRLAHELAHLPSLAHALYYTAFLHQFRREPGPAHEHLRQLIACSTERGFSYWEARGMVLLGWVRCQEGHADEGIATMLRGVEATQALGAELAQPNYLAMLAEAYRAVGETAAGLRAVAEGLKRAQQTGECRWEAELHRLRGELLLAAGDEHADEAAAALRQALALAQRQRARPFELRAAVSLRQLERRRYGAAQGPELETVYRSFTEGFQTPDLRDASALLETT